ncbi:hypothetical protein T310_6614, partial [Rasamsonia emersonii CBS 393.64]
GYEWIGSNETNRLAHKTVDSVPCNNLERGLTVVKYIGELMRENGFNSVADRYGKWIGLCKAKSKNSLTWNNRKYRADGNLKLIGLLLQHRANRDLDSVTDVDLASVNKIMTAYLDTGYRANSDMDSVLDSFQAREI